MLPLIGAHALLHQSSRERTADGAVVATYEDYASVRDLVWDVMADAADQTVPSNIRETVAAVEALTQANPLDEGVTYTQVAVSLQVDKSTAQRRSRVAIGRGFIRNLEPRRSLPARLIVGDPLPADGSLLPTATALARLHGCGPDGEEESEYPRSMVVADDGPAGDPDNWTTVPAGRVEELGG